MTGVQTCALPIYETPVVLRHKGDKDQAAAIVSWPTSGGFAGTKEARQLEVLTQIFNDRLFEKIRVADAAALGWDGEEPLWAALLARAPLLVCNDTGVSHTGTGSEATLTVYAKVPAGQNTLPAGSYNDTVQATVTF